MNVRFTSMQRTALHGVVIVLLVHGLALALILTASGCLQRPSVSASVLDAQTPGAASGAGANLTGPGNSAAATTQTAVRRVGFYPPPMREPLPMYGKTAVTPPPVAKPSAPAQSAEVAAHAIAATYGGAPAPAWIDERTETSFGAHQDASGIIKAAGFLAGWGRARWLGIVLMLAAAFGLAWAHGNAEGYPLICWQVGGAGLFLALFDPSPWWLLLLLLPAGFYVAQKLNLLRLP